MWNCFKCGKEIPDSKNFCASCALPKPKYQKNYCTNPECVNFHQELDPMQKACEECGSLTTIGKVIDELT